LGPVTPRSPVPFSVPSPPGVPSPPRSRHPPQFRPLCSAPCYPQALSFPRPCPLLGPCHSPEFLSPPAPVSSARLPPVSSPLQSRPPRSFLLCSPLFPPVLSPHRAHPCPPSSSPHPLPPQSCPTCSAPVPSSPVPAAQPVPLSAPPQSLAAPRPQLPGGLPSALNTSLTFALPQCRLPPLPLPHHVHPRPSPLSPLSPLSVTKCPQQPALPIPPGVSQHFSRWPRTLPCRLLKPAPRTSAAAPAEPGNAPSCPGLPPARCPVTPQRLPPNWAPVH
ncbi:hypothetical protein H1C71_019532, partial [Ictidomys tridecemlineatus]